MYSHYILLVLACFVFVHNVKTEEKSYKELVHEMLHRIENYKRDGDAENMRRNYLHRLVNENVEKDEKLNGRSYDYENYLEHERSYIPLPIHEDENEDIVDENLNDIQEEEEQVSNRKYHVDEDFNQNDVNFNSIHTQSKKPTHKSNSVEVNEAVTEKHTITMPHVSPQHMDTYLCYSYELPKDDRYIIEFKPHAKMEVAHHMLLFGCEEPFKKKEAWNCREMQPVCGRGSQHIMYAWAKNAPSLEMPENVGFHVGKNSGVRYLVLQVHYLHVEKFKNGGTDTSGLEFVLTQQRKRFLAGIYLLADGWTDIPPHTEKAHIDMGCEYPLGAPKMEPFRFRTHAHKLGLVITGYRVRDGKWTLIGRGDPQRPQAFYKVFNDIDVLPGDKLLGRCTYNSTSRDRVTHIGATHNDEMCNFYIMYFYDSYNGTSDKIGCLSLETSKYTYPPDSDVALAVMEARNKAKYGKKDETNKHKLYKQVKGWPAHAAKDGDLPMSIGQVTGVAFDEHNDQVIIFQRGSHTWGADTFDEFNNIRKNYQKNIRQKTLIWLDRRTGDVKKAAGARMFSLPHGVTVDHEGYIWVTDVGSHQVFKLSKDLDPKTKELKVILSVGVRFENGNDSEHLCKPTDVAVMTDGSFFVADGYCNSRVLKFDKTGKLIMEISESSFQDIYSFPDPKYMVVVHSLALDEANKRLYVADRENGRVLIFNCDTGEFISHLSKKFGKGAVYAIAYNKHDGGVLHVVTGERGMEKVQPSGYTYSLKDDKVIGKWKPHENLHHPHDLAVTSNNRETFISEIGPNKIWKFESTKSRP